MNPEKEAVQAVITAPSRELATQIYNEIRKVTKYSEKKSLYNLLLVAQTNNVRLIN